MSRRRGVMLRDEMRAPSASLVRLRNDNEDPYQNLANAIVCVAADDYRTALKDNNEKLLENLQNFFHSAWCGLLTNVDTDMLMRALENEHGSCCPA